MTYLNSFNLFLDNKNKGDSLIHKNPMNVNTKGIPSVSNKSFYDSIAYPIITPIISNTAQPMAIRALTLFR